MKGFAAAQRAYDAMEPPTCDEPDPPEHGCNGDERAICTDCRGRGVMRGRYIATDCETCDGSGVVPCDGCDVCAPIGMRECEICGRRAQDTGSEARCVEHCSEGTC